MCEDQIECDVHGTAYVTFVCQHLVSGEDDVWHSAEPESDDDWPSAWCRQCHIHFEVEGEWNEDSEAAADIGNNVQIICHLCYQTLKSKCSVNLIE